MARHKGDEDEVLRVLRDHSAYELAESYLFNVEHFCDVLLDVLDLGTLAVKVFIFMHLHKSEWTSIELSKAVRNHRSNVYVALCLLEKKGLVQRVSRYRWRLESV